MHSFPPCRFPTPRFQKNLMCKIYYASSAFSPQGWCCRSIFRCLQTLGYQQKFRATSLVFTSDEKHSSRWFPKLQQSSQAQNHLARPDLSKLPSEKLGFDGCTSSNHNGAPIHQPLMFCTTLVWSQTLSWLVSRVMCILQVPNAT